MNMVHSVKGRSGGRMEGNYSWIMKLQIRGENERES